MLWVDDDKFMITVFESLVGSLTSSLRTVTGKSAGEQAVDLIRSEHYDVVITDRRMPGIDGFEVAATVRQVDKVLGRKPTPVIMVATSDVSRLPTGKWDQRGGFGHRARRRCESLSVNLIHKPDKRIQIQGMRT